MNIEQQEKIDELGNEWVMATPERRFTIESDLRAMGCRVTVTPAGNLHISLPGPVVYVEEIAPVDWQKITSAFLVGELKKAIERGETPAVTYRTWDMVGRVWQPVEKRAIVLKAATKRVYIRLEDGTQKWAEPRNISPIVRGGEATQ